MSQADLPPPLVPAEVDLRDFKTMPLDVARLRDSRFASEVRPEAFRSGVLLWCAAWHQVPAGSLPDNDSELAKLAGYGFVVKEWRKVKAQAMTKFVLCSDGRWYHEEIAERAATAWRSRLEHFYERARERLRKANKARSDKGLSPMSDLTFDQWNSQRLAGALPMEKAEAFLGLPAEVLPETPAPAYGFPPENALKGEGEGTERERNGELFNKPPDGGSSAAPRAAPPPPPVPPFDGANEDRLSAKALAVIATNFELPEAWGLDAEALGFKPNDVLREAEKFRQYWTAGKGKGKRRTVKGWRQTWSNWLDKAAGDRR